MRSPELAPQMGWRLWLTAVRPRTLPLAASPVILGAALAQSSVPLNGVVVLLALSCALLIQMGTNLHNDAADGEKGLDGHHRLGPLRVTAAGWADPEQVRRGAYTCFALAFLEGIFLVQSGGWPILIIGVLSLLAALSYSAGPWPISHSPFGELFAGVFFGPVAILGMQLVLGAPLGLAAWLAGAALGALSAAVLIVNNLRDRVGDAKAGRRTLAIVLGPRRARHAYQLFLITPLLLTPWIAHASQQTGVYLGLLALPAFVRLFQTIARREGKALNQQLAASAQTSAIYGILTSIGLVLGG